MKERKTNFLLFFSYLITLFLALFITNISTASASSGVNYKDNLYLQNADKSKLAACNLKSSSIIKCRLIDFSSESIPSSFEVAGTLSDLNAIKMVAYQSNTKGLFKLKSNYYQINFGKR